MRVAGYSKAAEEGSKQRSKQREGGWPVVGAWPSYSYGLREQGPRPGGKRQVAGGQNPK